MRVLSQNRLLAAAVVAAGIVALCGAEAQAWGHGRAGSYGSYGSSGSSASYGGYAYGASSGSYGSYGASSGSYGGYSASSGKHGLFARWHARKAAKHAASSGSSGSYGGYYAASSGSSGGYGASSGSHGSYGSAGSYAVPMEMESAPADAPVDGVTPEVPTEPSASIRVTTPADALVFVNDRPTTSTGTERTFVSRGLSTGRTYAYQLRVEFTRDGEKVVENKLVRLQAGESIDLAFGNGEQLALENAATTELTLHVPAEATVTLAGAATQQTGDVRSYATDALTAGQTWDGYVVRVELERDGKTLVEEKTMSIVGGENYEVSFDFADEATQVAGLN